MTTTQLQADRPREVETPDRSAREGRIRLDALGHIAEFDATALKLIGERAARLIGTPWQGLLDEEPGRPALWVRRAGRPPGARELRIQRAAPASPVSAGADLERLRALGEGARDAVFRYALLGARFEYLSPAIEPMTGWARNALYENPLLVAHCLSAGHRKRAWVRLVARVPRAPFSLALKLKSDGPGPRWIEVLAMPVLDAAGHVQALEGVVRDISARKRAAQALRESERCWQFALEGSADGVWDLDVAARRVRRSASWYRNMGHAPGSVERLDDWRALIHPDDRASVSDALKDFLAGADGAYIHEYRIRAGDGSYRWVLSRGLVISRDADGSALRVVGTHTDLTRRKQMEIELRTLAETLEARVAERTAQLRSANHRLRREIDEAGRLRSLARHRQDELERIARIDLLAGMASGIAHELNQPLAAMQYLLAGCRRIATDPDSRPEDIAGALDQAAAQLRRTGQILRHVRDFSRRRDPHMETQALAPLLQGAVELAHLEPRTAGARLRCLPVAPECWVHVDRVQIEQVLLNLIRNAGESLQSLPCESAEVTIATEIRGNVVVIYVRDNGPGFDSDALQHAFRPFHTTRIDGMGLGLSICERIVQTHHGTIAVQNQPEGGACISVCLPLAQPQTR